MKSLSEQANSVTSEMLQVYDESELYVELALITKDLQENPEEGIELAPQRRLLVEQTEVDMEQWKELGKKIFNRWNNALYELICGSESDDKKDRQDIVALFASEVTLAGGIAVILTSTFGVAPAVAVIIGTIVVKRFFKPAYEEACVFWKENLSKSSVEIAI